MIRTAIRFLGFQSGVVASEKLVATLGGMLAIFCCFYITTYFTGAAGSAAILPSMGGFHRVALCRSARPAFHAMGFSSGKLAFSRCRCDLFKIY